MVPQRRDSKGKFFSENPKRIVMRVTEKEKHIIEKYRQIKPSKIDQDSQFYREIQTLVRRRVQNLEI